MIIAVILKFVALATFVTSVYGACSRGAGIEAIGIVFSLSYFMVPINKEVGQ